MLFLRELVDRIESDTDVQDEIGARAEGAVGGTVPVSLWISMLINEKEYSRVRQMRCHSRIVDKD